MTFSTMNNIKSTSIFRRVKSVGGLSLALLGSVDLLALFLYA